MLLKKIICDGDTTEACENSISFDQKTKLNNLVIMLDSMEKIPLEKRLVGFIQTLIESGISAKCIGQFAGIEEIDVANMLRCPDTVSLERKYNICFTSMYL